MAKNKLTNDDLGRMIEKGFDENTEQHQQILEVLDKHAVILINHTEILKDHTEKLNRLEKNQKVILTKLEGIVYRKEFEKLESRVKIIEEVLAIKKRK